MSGEGQLTEMVKTMAMEGGFSAVAIALPAPSANSEALMKWLEKSWYADMDFMSAISTIASTRESSSTAWRA